MCLCSLAGVSLLHKSSLVLASKQASMHFSVLATESYLIVASAR